MSIYTLNKIRDSNIAQKQPNSTCFESARIRHFIVFGTIWQKNAYNKRHWSKIMNYISLWCVDFAFICVLWIEKCCNNVGSGRNDDTTAYFILHFMYFHTRNSVLHQNNKCREGESRKRDRNDIEWRSDKGHVWLITLIFELMYKRFVADCCCCGYFFALCTQAMRHTLLLTKTSETSYLLSDRFAWAQIRKWACVSFGTFHMKLKFCWRKKEYEPHHPNEIM